MSEFNFGYGHGNVAARREKALDRIARKHGGKTAFFLATSIPGNGDCYWFGIPNFGSPFDQSTSSAIIKEAEERGLWPIR